PLLITSRSAASNFPLLITSRSAASILTPTKTNPNQLIYSWLGFIFVNSSPMFPPFPDFLR
ncbi:MAG: hypothetical protein MUO54_12045, partial [Anaerolineales bacterium]|nr:hypothetical protein [Anaerolineales bacterium]